jgi:hypothetical protein
MKRVVLSFLLMFIILTGIPVWAIGDEYVPILTDPKPSDESNMFSDELISIKFSFYKKIGVGVDILNKTNNPVKIDWN